MWEGYKAFFLHWCSERNQRCRVSRLAAQYLQVNWFHHKSNNAVRNWCLSRESFIYRSLCRILKVVMYYLFTYRGWGGVGWYCTETGHGATPRRSQGEGFGGPLYSSLPFRCWRLVSGCTINGEVCLLPKHIAFLVLWERLMRHSEPALLAERK